MEKINEHVRWHLPKVQQQMQNILDTNNLHYQPFKDTGNSRQNTLTRSSLHYNRKPSFKVYGLQLCIAKWASAALLHYYCIHMKKGSMSKLI